jgi:putative ABC transport system permease protein
MDLEAARDTAAKRMGDLEALKRLCHDLGRRRDREMRLTQWLDECRADVKFALRQLGRSPGFALIAIVTLALGIGANSAMFALVDAALLRQLPYRDPDRLVAIWERSDAAARGAAALPNIHDWAEQSRSFDAMAGFVPGLGGSMVLSRTDGTAETLPRQWVTAGFFDVLGVTPVAGRTFVPEDERRRPAAVVVSEGVWRSSFGGDRSIVGRDIRLDGEPFTVIGIVATVEMQGPSGLWALRPLNGLPPAVRGLRVMQAMGRLKPGVTIQAASAEMDTIARQLALEFPDTNAGRGVMLEPLRDVLIGRELRLTSLLFLGVVGFVLLICCANVANLLLVRATVRRRELAVRAALGAGRHRVIRQLLTESLVLAALGGAAGVAVGAAILRVLPGVVPPDLLPPAVTLAFDRRVVAFCSAAALLVGVLFGLAPAWQVTRTSWREVLASNSRTATTGPGRLRGLLVIGEVATAVLLLFGAGLLLRTLVAVDVVDRGYRADDVLTLMVDPLGSQYPTPESLQQFFDDVTREVRAVPGVRSVAWATTLPLGPSDLGEAMAEIVGAPPLDAGRQPTADYQVVSPSYFQTLDLPIVAGRSFTDRDTRDAAPVCIVSEAFARSYLRGRSPIGTRIAVRAAVFGQGPAVVREIVGVARQVKGRPDEAVDLAQIYVPHAQNLFDDIYLLVRPSSGRAAALASGVRGAIGRVDRAQLVSVHTVRTLDDIAWRATDRHRFRAVIVSTFAGLALVLAMVGVFGVLAYAVQQRVREFGVRMALGAGLSDVLRLVVGGAIRLVAAGAVIGLTLAALFSRLLTSMLFGVEPLDLTTFAAVTVLLVLTAAVTAAAPAWRAARIDPVRALRTE